MPASFGDVPREEVEKYGRVLESYYRYLDGWIGKFITPDSVPGEGSAEGRPTLVLVVSPHGIDPLPLERRLLVALEGDRFESGYHGRAPDGLVVIAGPGVAHGKPLGKASILDVAPTLLYYFRLPIGADMDGHPLTRLFQQETLSDAPLLLIPSYEASRLSGLPDEASGSP
jgi:predicted AlkP superfamily phosphohydrolase/phosphomutase